ncbi:amidase [Pseudonocardia humida]|uniref:Amidase n=1 Tax=Pseudonocardia humida TaxID=2800819 RepID=A0ABT1A239_9PSEU|nr:amidase [Pseudonocardia humida]MCO1657060.1 amidase [Pseudonocardia humida]
MTDPASGSATGSVADALLDGPVPAIAAAVRAGAVAAEALVDAALRRIAERDPQLNAVVLLDADGARAAVGAGLPDGPLRGVPFLVKDLHTEVAGLALARGSRLFAGCPSPGTSTVVARLLAAGAVLLGRTNSPELGLNATTEPRLWGPTRNPHDPTRSAGGSSGGSAAAVAAGLVPFAHATDSGGSIRIPAAWCGVVGFKPTRQLNPTGPFRHDGWDGLGHEHVITRSVGDSAVLLGVTSGAATGDAHPRPPVRLDSLPPPPPMRIGLVDAPADGSAVHPACRDAALAAADTLRGLGHRVEPTRLPAVAATLGPVIGAVVAGHVAALVEDRERARGRRAEPGELEPAVADLVDRGRGTSAADHVRAVAALHRLGRDLSTALAGFDVLLTPTTAHPAPPLGALHTDRPAAELFAEIFRFAPFTGLFNVTGGPAISLPWGTHDGVPVGVQLAAAQGADATVLRLAHALERPRPDASDR